MNDMAFPAPMLTRSPGRLETMRLLRKSLSNPMDFWPPEIYQAPIVKVNFMGAARYFVSLAQQLNVLQPTSKAVFRFDARNVFRDLKLGHFRADSRKIGRAHV